MRKGVETRLFTEILQENGARPRWRERTIFSGLYAATGPEQDRLDNGPNAHTIGEYEETEAPLASLRDKVSASDGPRFFVCDNANVNRNLAERVFDSAVEVKQDPFHVIQRFTDKVKQLKKSKWLASTLSSAMYELDGNLRAHLLGQGFHVGKKAEADVNTHHLTVRSDLWADRAD